MKKVKSYKNIKKAKKKKNNNNLKKVRVKTSIETLRIQYKKYIKEIANAYIKRMVKDLGEKAFKHYIYIEYYNIALDFAQSLKLKKVLNITFNKELRISKEYLI